MRISTKVILAITIAAASVAPTGAYAKDWLQSVQLSKSGIDVVPIEVNSNGTGYSSLKTNSHKFHFGLYARATSGERIVAAALSSKPPAHYFEAQDSTEWRKLFVGRAVGSGTLRTWQTNFLANVPLSKVTWVGGSPVAKCNNILSQKRQGGASRVAVLNHKQTTTAYARFDLQAVAAHKNKASNNSWNIGSTDTENKSFNYPVAVTCLPNTMGGKISN